MLVIFMMKAWLLVVPCKKSWGSIGAYGLWAALVLSTWNHNLPGRNLEPMTSVDQEAPRLHAAVKYGVYIGPTGVTIP